MFKISRLPNFSVVIYFAGAYSGPRRRLRPYILFIPRPRRGLHPGKLSGAGPCRGPPRAPKLLGFHHILVQIWFLVLFVIWNLWGWIFSYRWVWKVHNLTEIYFFSRKMICFWRVLWLVDHNLPSQTKSGIIHKNGNISGKEYIALIVSKIPQKHNPISTNVLSSDSVPRTEIRSISLGANWYSFHLLGLVNF